MNFKDRFYLILAGIFIASLVSCNLIFQKFFTWTPFGIYTFEISVGILPYPITFLATDLISELYGKKKADQVVISGLVASVFVMIIVLIANAAPSTVWSPVDDNLFQKVFGIDISLLGFSRQRGVVLGEDENIRCVQDTQAGQNYKSNE